MNIRLSPKEYAVIQEMSRRKDMTPEQLFKFALRWYQLVDLIHQRGGRVKFLDRDGNEERFNEFMKGPINIVT